MSSKLKLFLFAFGIVLLGFSASADAGFLDTFNNANRAIAQTTGSVENAQRTIQRAGQVINKNKKPAQAIEQDIVVSPSQGQLSDKDRNAILKAKRAWVAAFKSADWDALVDHYAENAVVMPPDEEPQIGPQAIRANFATDEKTANEIFETVEMNGNDTMAYVQGDFSFTIQANSSNNPPVHASGKYIEIWQKQSDGGWLITHDIWNANPS